MKCVCGYQFALDPKTDKISDGKFNSFIRRASANNTYYFTSEQLYTAVCEKQVSGVAALILGPIVLVGGVIAAFYFWPEVPPLVAIVVGILNTTHGCYNHYFQVVPISQFETWLKKFEKQHGRIEKLVSRLSLDKPPPEWKEPDIFDYGVERIIIVERWILVDLLVKNGVHTSNSALIVAADGYPAYLTQRVETLLSESPELPVFLLHDATTKGIHWADGIKLARPYNNGKRKIVDMGVSPDDLSKLKRLRRRRMRKQKFIGPVDAIPMALLANGIVMSTDQNLTIAELIEQSASPDATSSFG